MLDTQNLDIAQFQQNAGRAEALLKALANRRRLLVLCQLADGEQTVSALQPKVGVSQSALSQHLAVLRDEGVVATRREGQTIWYRIADPAAARVIETLVEVFCSTEKR
jgi:DNA-binding transcriptional ArsR family regulator